MARRPVILILIKGLGLGGAERLVSGSASHWSRDRFDYRVGYVLPWKDQLTPDLERQGISVHCLGAPSGSVVRAFVRLDRFVKREGVELIHAHLPVTGLMARLLPGGPPVVYTEHNLQRAYRWPTRMANRGTYGMNEMVVAVSDAVKASARSARMSVVPNGVESLEVDDASVRTELGLTRDAPLVVHVGNIRPGKGHEDLIAVTGYLVQEFPNVAVVSVGGEKWPGDLDRLQGMVRMAGLDSHIRFLGRRDDARRFIAAADVYVNPAEVEGLPVTILEALSARRPVAATAVGGVPALIRDGSTGRLVPPARPEELAAAVSSLLHDPAEAARMSLAGSELVEREYGLAAMVARYEEMYRSILEGPLSSEG